MFLLLIIEKKNKKVLQTFSTSSTMIFHTLRLLVIRFPWHKVCISKSKLVSLSCVVNFHTGAICFSCSLLKRKI